MPVLTQITETSEKIFDAAESTNKRIHGATIDLVDRIADVEMPFADRLSKVEVPFADRLPDVTPIFDRLPEPKEAVDTAFDLTARGIAANRSLFEKVVDQFTDAPAPVATPVTKATPKKTTAKKTTAKKTTAKKTTDQKGDPEDRGKEDNSEACS